MRVIAFIEDGDVSKRILEHLGLPAEVPPPGSDAELIDGVDEHAAPWMVRTRVPIPAPGSDPDPNYLAE